MTRLANVCAWQAADRWRYAETRQAAGPSPSKWNGMNRRGESCPYWPDKDSATLIWEVARVD
jgi:hypothetical protein